MMKKIEFKKVKLLVIAKSIDGGTGTFVECISKLPYEVKVLVLEKSSFRKTNQNINVTFLRKNNFYPQKYRLSLKNCYNFFADLFSTKGQIESFNPNVIIGVDVHANLIISLFKFFFHGKSKLILTTHINLKDTLLAKGNGPINLLLKTFVGYFYNRANALVCISKGAALSLKNDFKIRKKINVIYYGIPNDTITGKREFPKVIKILTIGRFVEQKDQKTLIQAFSEFVKTNKSSKLIMVGDGPLKKDLKNLTRKLNIKSKVLFPGWVQDISNVMKDATIFSLSSLREGFGWVIIEAMAKGLPVVSTRAPYGPEEILDSGKYGLLAPVGDVKVLASSLLSLTNRKKYDYYSRMSVKRVGYFTEEKMIKSYMKLILKLI